MNKTAFMRELRRVRKLDIEQREQAIAEIMAREGIEPPPPTDAHIRIPRHYVKVEECKHRVIRFVGDDGPSVEQIRHLFRRD